MRRPHGGHGRTAARTTGLAWRMAPLVGPLWLLVGVFMLSTSCGGGKRDVVAEVQQAADTADELLIGMQFYLTDQGVRQAYLEADTAFVYENEGRTELKRVRLTFYKTTGEQTAVLTSDEGTYRGRQGNMEARGNVVVLQPDGGRLATSVLRFDQTKNVVSTDQHYTYVNASTNRNLEGDTLVTDPSFNTITTQNVRGRAGQYKLPGQ